MIKRVYNSIRFRTLHALEPYLLRKKNRKVSKYEINYDQNIYIFTNPRSGSTWLMEMFQTIPKTATIWEPFHPEHGPITKHYQLGWRPYLPLDYSNQELVDSLKKVFRNGIYSDWTISRSTLKQYKNAEKFIVKSVRANALLPWITNNLEFNHKPILLLRHPIPTTLSHIKAFGENKDPWSHSEKALIEADGPLFQPHKDYLLKLKSQLEFKLAVWCITNKEVLQYSEKKWQTIFYEKALLNPEEELFPILDSLGADLIKAKQIIEKPSWTSSGSYNQNAQIQIDKWKKNFNEEQLACLQKIFDHFNIKVYSAYSTLPIDLISEALTNN